MIPYSRPKLSDLYTLYQSKLLENHTLHSSTYLYCGVRQTQTADLQVNDENPCCGML